jgi:hypothetical protein
MARERGLSGENRDAGRRRRQQLYERAKQLESAAETTRDPQRRAHLLIDAQLYRAAADEAASTADPAAGAGS